MYNVYIYIYQCNNFILLINIRMKVCVESRKKYGLKEERWISG